MPNLANGGRVHVGSTNQDNTDSILDTPIYALFVRNTDGAGNVTGPWVWYAATHPEWEGVVNVEYVERAHRVLSCMAPRSIVACVCITTIDRAPPAPAEDLCFTAVVVGLTPGCVYIEGRPWDYADDAMGLWECVGAWVDAHVAWRNANVKAPAKTAGDSVDTIPFPGSGQGPTPCA